MAKKTEEHIIIIPGIKLNIPKKVKIRDNIIKINRNYIPTLLGVLYQVNNEYTIIPYKDIYKPKPGDYVVGIVVNYAPNGWIIELGTYTKGFLPAQDYIRDKKFNPKEVELSEYIKVGDIIGARVVEANRYSYFLLSTRGEAKDKMSKYLGILKNYYVIKVSSTKLPRIIGKKGSMIKTIKKKIDGDLVIAQNGVILYKGDYNNYLLLKRIINFIVFKTFAAGLTNAVASMFGVELEEGESDE